MYIKKQFDSNERIELFFVGKLNQKEEAFLYFSIFHTNLQKQIWRVNKNGACKSSKRSRIFNHAPFARYSKISPKCTF